MENGIITTPNTLINISIIEDSEIHREWLKTELIEMDKFNIISVDQLGRKGIESVKQYKPDLVILDFQLQDITGLEVSKRIKSQNNNIKIFVLTAHAEMSIIERLIDDKNINAIAIKGSHYFEKNFLAAILHVIEGGAYLDPSLLKKIRESRKSVGLSNLTNREFEIFIQINLGKTDNCIAKDLSVEPAHVKNMKSRISKKMKNENNQSLLLRLANNCDPDPIISLDINKILYDHDSNE
jgi:DNA-binding NarL/FixJ family response regulator